MKLSGKSIIEGRVCPYILIMGDQVEPYIAQGWHITISKFKGWYMADHNYKATTEEVMQELIHLSKCITTYSNIPGNSMIHQISKIMTKELKNLKENIDENK